MAKRATVRRAMLVAGVAVGFLFGTSGAAGAGEPVVQACVGTTFSDAAAALPGGDLGQVVRGFAQAPDARPGIGDGIQAVQAGDVPDDVAVNTCND